MSSTSQKKRPLFNFNETEEPENVKVEFITGISNGEFESSEPKAASGPLVIPLPRENTSTDLPEKYQGLLKKQKREHKGETVVASTEGYHLQSEEDKEALEALLKEARGEKEDNEESGFELPLILKYRNSNLDGIEDEQERFKIDLASRPDEASLHAYEEVPVTEFGTALLRGMGWAPGKPIGLTNPKVVEPIEFLRRPNVRGGLGSKDEVVPPSKSDKKIIKQGESREKPEPKVLPEGPEGVRKHVRRLDEQLVPLSKASGVYEGATVYIIEGKHEGLKGEILRILDDEVTLRLLSSGIQVKTSKSYVSAFASQKSSTSDSKKSSSSKDSSSKSSKVSSSSSWVYPHLVVRIVSKSFSGGKYYLQKGSVVDVIDKTRCTIQPFNSDSLIDIKLDMLETVIPKQGQKVMIVGGKYKGQFGKLISNNKEKVSVQLSDDLSIHSFDLDRVCSYEGSNE